MNATQFWIVVCARDLAAAAVAGGYVEVNHGKAGPLARMHAGDGIAFYSPRERYPDGRALQAFTAIGRVADAPITQSPLDHQPFRRAVTWLPATPAPVKPLLDRLTVIRNPANWGVTFRFGFLRVSGADFSCIARAMDCAGALALAQDSTAVAVPDAAAAGEPRHGRPRVRNAGKAAVAP